MSNVASVMSLAAEGGVAYELGLSPVLDTITGQTSVWAQRTVDVSSYSGATAYLVFEYLNGSSFTGDIQLDQIVFGDNTYTFESTVENFETTSNNPQTYDAVTWSALNTATSGGGLFLRDSGGTSSATTGLTTGALSSNFYVYAETSSPGSVSGYKFWLRSPSVVLTNPTLTYYEGRLGLGIGTLNVYLDVTA
jgi:hypothetical protein